jgi:NAD-dependent SIR2 family protein deacetylase
MDEAARSSLKNALNDAARILAGAESLLALTGAGISAESGLPTFCGADGLYDKWPDLAAVLSAEGLARNPRAIWDFINTFRKQAAAAQPNEAHRILAAWEKEKRFRRFLIATQNIDGLHQAAGSLRVSELHGSAWQIACPREAEPAIDLGFDRDFQSISSENTEREAILKKWSEANGREIWEDREIPFRTIPPYRDPHVRPNVLLFDEEYGTRLLWVQDFIRRKPDVILVIGCSGTLSVLWQLLGDCRLANPRCRIISINADQDAEIPEAIHVHLGATEAMRQLEATLRAMKSD